MRRVGLTNCRKARVAEIIFKELIDCEIMQSPTGSDAGDCILSRTFHYII